MAAELRAVAPVALGRCTGCAARYLVGLAPAKANFPLGTPAVNLTGSFVVAALMVSAILRGDLGVDARVFLVTGVLGGSTTMSAFAYETIRLVEINALLQAGAYTAATVLGSILMALLGRAIAGWWTGGT